MPKVSVIIPIYGVEKYIERCARSLFEQTLDDIEFLFIDDCTPDNSIHILQRVLKEYPHRNEQVIIHRMDQNSGQAKVREWGILHASGEYIIHCDSDDWLSVDIYHNLYEQAIAECADVVVCDYHTVTGNNFVKNKACNTTEREDFIADILTQKVSCSVWNKLISRDLYRSSDLIFPKDNMGEDVALVTQLLWKANKITYIDKPLYYYYNNTQSITKSVSAEKIRERFSQAISNAHIVASFVNENIYSPKVKGALVKFIFDQSYLIVPLCSSNSKYLLMWKDSIASIRGLVYKCSYLSTKNKLFFYFLLFRSFFCK